MSENMDVRMAIFGRGRMGNDTSIAIAVEPANAGGWQLRVTGVPNDVIPPLGLDGLAQGAAGWRPYPTASAARAAATELAGQITRDMTSPKHGAVRVTVR